MPTSLATKEEMVFKGQRKGNTNRLQPYRQEQVRAQIQVRSILNIIQDHVLNGTEIASTRLHFGMKLIDKVLPNAIPDAVTANLQANTAQALSSINQAQLMAMAKEMLANQGLTIEHAATVENSSVDKLVDTNLSKDLLGGVGMVGVGGVVGVSNPSVAQTSSEIYPDRLPDELG